MTHTLRNYVKFKDIEDYMATSFDVTKENLRLINIAEEMIDDYVGFQTKFLGENRYRGFISAVTTNSITDTLPTSQLFALSGYFKYATLEMLDGTQEGERRIILDSDYQSRTLTIEPFDALPAIGDMYIVYQLGKFPREIDGEPLLNKFYKRIPEQVKRAVAAQIEYILVQGDEFFLGATDKTNENIKGYSYSVKHTRQRLIAPKARELLKGIYNIKGQVT